MLSEKKYREVVGEVCKLIDTDNNDFILSMAIHGLVLLPQVGNKRPFSHYVQAPMPVYEISNTGKPIKAWADSWIVDADYQDHLKSEVAKFNFTPLRK